MNLFLFDELCCKRVAGDDDDAIIVMIIVGDNICVRIYSRGSPKLNWNNSNHSICQRIAFICSCLLSTNTDYGIDQNANDE